MPTPAETELQLAQLLGELALYPLEYVYSAYPWGKPGPLEPWDGPDDWQAGFLREWGEEIRSRRFDGSTPVEPIRGSVVSGRGVGKSGLVGMACDFITATRPHCKGTVTANTGPQLETKTWPEIVKWKRLGLTAHWFKITSGRGSMRMLHRSDDDALPWRLDAMQWQENRADAFTGQHAPMSTSFYIFDEASGIPRIIVEAADDGLTSGEPMMFMFGNGRRNSGPFYESHGRSKDRYHIRKQVDGRYARMTNHKEIEKNIEEMGLDSDRIRIEVLGKFPNQAAGQFIAGNIVREAMERPFRSANITDPLIIGCDVAWQGDDASVIRIRQGLDGRSYPKERYQGQDPMFLAGRLADLNKKLRPDAIFVDMTGIGAGVVARCRQLDCDVIGVHNGGRSPDPTYHRQGDYMWGELKQWMIDGGCLPDDPDLERELTAREYSYDNQNAYVLERKEELKARGEPSPDDGDAFALTFAMRVGPRSISRVEAVARGEVESRVIGVDANPMI